MKEREFRLHDGKAGAAFTVSVVPHAKRNEISEILSDGTVKVRLTAPGGDDKSNQALLTFLAEILEVKPSQLEIVAGISGNDKLITVMNIDKAAVNERIYRHVN